eukprot:scaffold104802_cov31-Tisochrysis_lutea.AAC.6
MEPSECTTGAPRCRAPWPTAGRRPARRRRTRRTRGRVPRPTAEACRAGMRLRSGAGVRDSTKLSFRRTRASAVPPAAYSRAVGHPDILCQRYAHLLIEVVQVLLLDAAALLAELGRTASPPMWPRRTDSNHELSSPSRVVDTLMGSRRTKRSGPIARAARPSDAMSVPRASRRQIADGLQYGPPEREIARLESCTEGGCERRGGRSVGGRPGARGHQPAPPLLLVRPACLAGGLSPPRICDARSASSSAEATGANRFPPSEMSAAQSDDSAVRIDRSAGLWRAAAAATAFADPPAAAAPLAIARSPSTVVASACAGSALPAAPLPPSTPSDAATSWRSSMDDWLINGCDSAGSFSRAAATLAASVGASRRIAAWRKCRRKRMGCTSLSDGVVRRASMCLAASEERWAKRVAAADAGAPSAAAPASRSTSVAVA